MDGGGNAAVSGSRHFRSGDGERYQGGFSGAVCVGIGLNSEGVL
jgi:hypothetical protein